MSISTTWGNVLAGQVDGLAPVGRLADDVHRVLRVDQRDEAAADGRLIVRDEHADHDVLLLAA